MINSKNRKFENENYLNFIRGLPCAITGRAGEDVHAHHADVIGRQGIRNDYYAIPLKYHKHMPNLGHITAGKLTAQLQEDPRDRAIFYLSMYIEKLEGRYDPDMDDSAQYLTLRRKLIGKE